MMANLREVLQATHQLRANTKNLDTQKRDLLSKLESSTKKRLEISSPSSTSSFGNLESLVELLNLNENSKSNANLKNNTYRTYQQNTRSGKSAAELGEKSHHHNPQQRLRSFRSSSPNNNKLATSSTNAEATKPMNGSSGGHMLNSNKLENLKRNFNQRRNSIDLIPFEESHDLKKNVPSSECATIKNQSKSSVAAMVKQSISFNNYEKILGEKFNECSNQEENVVAPPLESLSTDSSSNNWNYDELNELRMKFISLLSDSSKDDDDEETNKQAESAGHLKETKEVLMEMNKPNSNVDMTKSKSNLFTMVSFVIFLMFLKRPTYLY
jgi:hypothetical protein